MAIVLSMCEVYKHFMDNPLIGNSIIENDGHGTITISIFRKNSDESPIFKTHFSFWDMDDVYKQRIDKFKQIIQYFDPYAIYDQLNSN